MTYIPEPRMAKNQTDFLLSALSQALETDGQVAEVGVYEGGTARLMWQKVASHTSKHLYLFDTFEGLKPGEGDPTGKQYIGAFQGDESSVRQLFLDEQRVHIIKGDCVETLQQVADKQFCFVNIDVDLYKPTYVSIQFFRDRLSKGGVILIHDYQGSDMVGVKRAVTEILGSKPETVSGFAVTRRTT